MQHINCAVAPMIGAVQGESVRKQFFPGGFGTTQLGQVVLQGYVEISHRLVPVRAVDIDPTGIPLHLFTQ